MAVKMIGRCRASTSKNVFSLHPYGLSPGNAPPSPPLNFHDFGHYRHYLLLFPVSADLSSGANFCPQELASSGLCSPRVCRIHSCFVPGKAEGATRRGPCPPASSPRLD